MLFLYTRTFLFSAGLFLKVKLKAPRLLVSIKGANSFSIKVKLENSSTPFINSTSKGFLSKPNKSKSTEKLPSKMFLLFSKR